MFDFLKKTFSAINSAKPKNKIISKEALEDMLLEADVEYSIVEEILYYLPPSDMVKRDDLKRVMLTYFLYPKQEEQNAVPFVELILGVNGAGKTTTIAKLANLYKTNGKKVMLGACDTFRAGAVEQLKLWAKKIDVPIIFSAQGHDPAAVAFDTINSAISKKYDRVLIDTAGRLQNQKNLANELEKIVRISSKAMESAPHRKILILDGTQGTAGYSQAKAFNEILKLDGVIITKLDGTPKGGALFSIARELELPILFVGTGEKQNDIMEFNSEEFVNSILDSIFE